MTLWRHKGMAAFLLVLGAAAPSLWKIPARDRAVGQFSVRPVVREEVRSPTDGFLRAIAVQEGQTLGAGQPVARVESLRLDSLLAEKRSKMLQAQCCSRQSLVELAHVQDRLKRIQQMIRQNAASPTELEETRTKCEVARQANQQAEAKFVGLRQEVQALEAVQARLQVRSTHAGTVVTPHLSERQGAYLEEGDLICVIEDCSQLEAQIVLDEREVAGLQAGQEVVLKMRTRPYQQLHTRVSRVAPSAGCEQHRGQFTVYCPVPASCAVRPGMTGSARVFGQPSSVGQVLSQRTIGRLQAEFHW